MKKSILLNIFSLVFLLCCMLFSCTPKRQTTEIIIEDSIKVVKVPSEEAIRKKNKVHTMFEKYWGNDQCELYTYNEEGFLIKSSIQENCKKGSAVTSDYIYDKENRLLETITYKNGKYDYKWVNVYHDSLLEKKIFYRAGKDSAEVQQRYIYKDGLLSIEEDNSFQTSYTYDSHGLCTSIFMKELGEKISGDMSESYLYNKNGWKIASFSNSGGILGSQDSQFRYDSTGKIVEEHSDHKSFGIQHSMKYEYNPGGLLLKKIHSKKVSGMAQQYGQHDETDSVTYEYTFYK